MANESLLIESLLLKSTVLCRWDYEAESTSTRDASRLGDAARSAAARAGRQQRSGTHAAAAGCRAAHAEDARLATRAAAAGDRPDQRALWYVPTADQINDLSGVSVFLLIHVVDYL